MTPCDWPSQQAATRRAKSSQDERDRWAWLTDRPVAPEPCGRTAFLQSRETAAAKPEGRLQARQSRDRTATVARKVQSKQLARDAKAYRVCDEDRGEVPPDEPELVLLSVGQADVVLHCATEESDD